MPMPTRLPAIQAVGKLFGMSSEAQAGVLEIRPDRMLPPAQEADGNREGEQSVL